MKKYLFFFIIILVGIFFFFFNKEENVGLKDKEINSFEECVKAGYPILESYPKEQCLFSPDGVIFEREFSKQEEKNSEDNSYGIFSPKYISFQKWETKIVNLDDGYSSRFNIVDGGIDCEAKDDIFNKTKKKVIDKQVYCIEESSEGAAGSIYTEYTYSTIKEDFLITVNFLVHYIQCSNYPESQKIECEAERKNFSFDEIVDKVSRYAFDESLKDHQERSIVNYLLTQKDFSWQNHENSHRFCSIESLDHQKELFPYYIWVYCGEYIIEDGQLKNLSGASLPAKIDYPNELSFYSLNHFSHEIPLDGAYYGESVEEIFPKEIQGEIVNFRKEGRVKKIIEKNEDQAWVNILAWEAIKSAIKNCRVERIFQAHSRKVVANLKNGEEWVAVEPKIDQIISLATQAIPRCGEIIMSTE